jgi:hypothetical protein
MQSGQYVKNRIWSNGEEVSTSNPFPVSDEKQDIIISNQTNASQKSQIVSSVGESVGVTDERLNVSTNDVTWLVQHSFKVDGNAATIYKIMGSRVSGWSSTSVLGDVCEYLDTSQPRFNTPTVDQTLFIVSTNANDTSGGTGANTVRVVYLDGNGLQQNATYTMNGTTPVNMGTGFSFIQWAETASVGSNTVAIGNISISSTNGAATVATTFEYIASQGGRSLSGRYKVPSNKHVHMIDWSAAAISSTMDVRLRADTFADNGLSANVFHFKDRAFLASGQNYSSTLHYEEYPANSIIKVSAFPGGTPAGNKLDSHFTIIVMDGVA